MHVEKTAGALRERLHEWRRKGDHVALVPTMGNLHDGHLSLITLAREHAERIVVSVFVNPTQFEAGADFENYPRTLATDKRKLKRANADILFVPEVDTMYPFGIEGATTVSVPKYRDDLCGAFRPGHFDGVTTVVSRLFGLVSPDVAVFGQKDFQQQLVIRRMVDDLHWPVKIVTGETVREESGLAYSSRNQYLTGEERQVAPGLYSMLRQVGRELQSGRRNFSELESQAMATLSGQGFSPEYVAI
ncbi:MAG TPA: pantoate--beta-alanine ligase, partial [Woeseiaceae bacterium]|nr:pantoate--beta-alanine ligase [Woeseiaceae bacterium]